MNKIVICSHPDDETIFCGGTILSHPEDKWHVVCMTFTEEHPRGREFIHAMANYRKLGIDITWNMLGMTDIQNELTPEELDQWEQALINVDLGDVDTIYTHNRVGEYRHHHHIVVNKLVNELFKPKIYEFICPTMWRLQLVYQPFLRQTKVVPLSPEVLRNKLDIYNYNYTSQLENWRNLPDIMRFEFSSTFEVFTSK